MSCDQKHKQHSKNVMPKNNNNKKGKEKDPESCSQLQFNSQETIRASPKRNYLQTQEGDSQNQLCPYAGCMLSSNPSWWALWKSRQQPNSFTWTLARLSTLSNTEDTALFLVVKMRRYRLDGYHPSSFHPQGG